MSDFYLKRWDYRSLYCYAGLRLRGLLRGVAIFKEYWYGRRVDRQYVPAQPRTGEQQGNRQLMYEAVYNWHQFDAETKSFYNREAYRLKLYGYHRYITYYLNANKPMIIYWGILQKSAINANTIEQELDTRYLKLNASNIPLTSKLDIQWDEGSGRSSVLSLGYMHNLNRVTIEAHALGGAYYPDLQLLAASATIVIGDTTGAIPYTLCIRAGTALPVQIPATSAAPTYFNTGIFGIGTDSPNANAQLDVVSTTKAFMPPRMTSIQKAAISSPTAGMVIYDNVLGKLCIRGATAWETIRSEEPFPVGSVFLSVVSTDPSTLLGYGTWAAIGAGRVLVGLDAGDANFDTVEETGGAKTSTPDAHAGTAVGAHDNHVFTQPNDHAAKNTDQTGSAAIAKGSSTANVAANTHVHNITAYTHAGGAVNAHSAHSVTQPSAHAAMSIVQPYFVVYMWKRTA